MNRIWDALVARALVDKITFVQFRDVVTPAMLKDSMLNQVWKLAGSFFDRYKKMPSQDEMTAWLRTLPASERERGDDYTSELSRLYGKPADFNKDVLRDEVVEAIKQHKVEQLLLDGSAMHEAGRLDYESLMSSMKDILNVSLDTSLGLDVFKVAEETIDRMSSPERDEYITTGITGLDKLIGGWKKGQFACGIAPSSVGKSTILVNHAVGAAVHEHNVLLLTVELEDFRVVERVIKRIAKMTDNEFKKDKQKAKETVGKFFRFTHSRLIVKYARPGSFTVADLDNYLDRLEIMEDFVPDLVAVDYLDEMRPSADDRRVEKRHQHSGIARDLTGLAKDRQVAVVTETQTNRNAVNKEKVTEKDIGEDYGKIKIADVNYAICQTEKEYNSLQARLRILKNRDGRGKGKEVHVKIDYPKMVVRSLEAKTYQEG